MQYIKSAKKSQIVISLLLTSLMLILLFAAITNVSALAASGDTIEVITNPEDYTVGSEVEFTAIYTSDKVIEGALLSVDLPAEAVTFVKDKGVTISLNGGEPVQATKKAYNTVMQSKDYLYSTERSLLVSLGDLDIDDVIMIKYSLIINDDSSSSIIHRLHRDNSLQNTIASSPFYVVIPVHETLKVSGEKTSETDNETLRIGETIQYSITAKNDSVGTYTKWTNVKVTDTLSEYVTFTDNVKIGDEDATEGTDIGQYTYNEANKTLTVYLPDLCGGNTSASSSTVTFTVEVNEGSYGQSIKNSASIIGWDEKGGEDKSGEDKEIDVDDGDGKKVVDFYTIKFHSNASDATGTMVDQGVIEGDSVQLNDNQYVRDNYEFLGWSTNSGSTVVEYEDGDTLTPSGNMDLYAVWKNSIVNVTITFDKNNPDATPDSMDPQIVVAGEDTYLNKNIFECAERYFAGWSTEPDTKTVVYEDGKIINVSEDITLYAVWYDDPCYITFDKNAPEGKEVTGEMEVQVVQAKVPVDLNANKYACTRHEFLGWSTIQGASGIDEVMFTDGQEITPIDSMTLYAVWSEELVFTDDHIAYIQGYQYDGDPMPKVWPDENITRAEASEIFFKLLDNKNVSNVTSPFNDVDSNLWYAQAINYLASVGIVDGYEDGSFLPEQPIKRSEFTKMASLFADVDIVEVNTFPDVPDSHWAVGYINTAYTEGWIQGDDYGNFNPDDNISRAEVVTIVNRMLNRVADKSVVDSLDIPYSDLDRDHYAFYDFMEASIEHEYNRDERQSDNQEIWITWVGQ